MVPRHFLIQATPLIQAHAQTYITIILSLTSYMLFNNKLYVYIQTIVKCVSFVIASMFNDATSNAARNTR